MQSGQEAVRFIMMIEHLICIFSTSALIVLWFRIVKKELQEKRDMTECARIQLAASRERRLNARDPEEIQKSQEIFRRSLDIFEQSVEIYNRVLRKPLNSIPGRLQGFSRIER